MRKIFLLSFLILPFFVKAQLNDISARTIALGGSGQTLVSPWAAYYNQANLPLLADKITAGIFYNGFLSIPGLSDKALTFAYKFTDNNTIALDFISSGIDVYNTQKLGIAYGQKIANNFYLGGQINLHRLNQPDYYGDIYTATGEVSFLYINRDITGIERLALGARAFNFTYGLLDKYQPVILNLGLNIDFTKKAGFFAETQLASDNPLIIRWGAMYRPVSAISLMVGGYLQNNIYTITFGTGIKYRWIRLNFGFESHPLRGMSGAAGIVLGI